MAVANDWEKTLMDVANDRINRGQSSKEGQQTPPKMLIWFFI